MKNFTGDALVWIPKILRDACEPQMRYYLMG